MAREYSHREYYEMLRSYILSGESLRGAQRLYEKESLPRLRREGVLPIPVDEVHVPSRQHFFAAKQSLLDHGQFTTHAHASGRVAQPLNPQVEELETKSGNTRVTRQSSSGINKKMLKNTPMENKQEALPPVDYEDPSTCRVCLENTATIPIFDVKESPDPDVYSKLCQCLGEKIEDEKCFPRHICNLCLITLNTAYKFINQYKKSDRILRQYLKKETDIENQKENSDNLVILEKVTNANDVNIKEEFLEDNFFDNYLEDNFIEDNYLKEISISRTKKTAKKVTKKKTVKRKSVKKTVSKDIEGSDDNIALSNIKKTTTHESKQNLESDDPTLPCPHCNRMVPKAKLKRHISRNHRQTPNVNDKVTCYVCEICGMNFDSLSKFTWHRLSVHRGLVKCPHCNKDCNKLRLKKHVRYKHSGITYPCSICSKTFGSLELCRRHEKTVHLKLGIRRFDCKMCDRNFASLDFVKIHTRSVHTGERPFGCQHCTAAFHCKDSLKEHTRQHTGEKPYKCPICGKGHTIAANVKSHLRHNHFISELDEATKEALAKSKINYLKHMRP